MGPPLLRLQGVSTGYGDIAALRNVSAEVRSGELVCIIGSNGAGKTTLLRTVSGLLRPRSGQIWFGERNITSLAPHRIVELGISQVPQGREIFGSLTVRENLMLGAYLRHRKREWAGIQTDLDFVFHLFPVLKERERQRAGTLSGGQQQMLAIGRSLMSKPRLLLLDEPSLGLAPLFVKEIFNHVTRLHQQGMTVLLVEQNARIALSVADRAYVLQTGEVRMEGPARELMEDPEIKRFYLGSQSGGQT